MPAKTSIIQAEKAVDKLLEHYNEYLELNRQLGAVATQQLQVASALAKEYNLPLSMILQQRQLYQELEALATERSRLQAQAQAVSDAMTFANPIVWIMYKHRAYQNTSHVIADMDDLRRHCQKPGYICTKRYQFLKTAFQRTLGVDLDDTARYPANLALPKLYTDASLVQVIKEPEFRRQWHRYEYYRDAQGVAKWENYPDPKKLSEVAEITSPS